MKRVEFLIKFVQSPQTVGSITPSSSFLAKAILKPIEWQSIHSIVELGAGTGIFTGYIQKLKKPSCKTFIFENDPDLQKKLTVRFPDMNHYSNAQDLTHFISDSGLQSVDCIVSSLPFANFPGHLREHLLDEIQTILKPDGLFITYQYSLHMKKYIKERFKQVDIKFVLCNIPPAFVYICRQK
ncbi:class I SAM-dependent methyltransferase [Hazenella coriacea]|uniref:Phospholipid N-methyltransferase n=1 Tax=Hazenella coriacea TaxID=1179467 RepID=A0A4R3L9K0_9BACL|nr:methyltransferase domain-containing protein [Hazenella coriacea]TCS95785.1 phospholipid N-methyltransferase [Hazenella coriacea]